MEKWEEFRDFMERALMIIPHIPEEKTEAFSLCISLMQYVQQLCRCCTLKPISETVDLLSAAYLGQWRDSWGKKIKINLSYVSAGIYPA